MTAGFLLIDKEGGWTSHDVVAKARGVLGIRKIGHAGTLDPMATGLLVLGVGSGTRLLRFVQDAPKTYEARAQFGVATDTLDADGAVLSREPMAVTEDEVREAAQRFVGTISQVPPMVSAVKVEGRRLYELAREGVEVERPARTVVVDAIDVLDFAPSDYPVLTMRIVCGAGTYVRTLADDIAGALGGRAHLTSLRRTSIGSLHVDDALGIGEVADADDPAAALVPLSSGLADLPAVTVDAETARGVRSGMVFAASAFSADIDRPFRVVEETGRLLAVYASDGRRAKPEVVVS